ncbi:MAG TPA: nucleotide exchange factor GrpE [Chloroflexota bacterium]|nr:nucleotide exchange factor GrpE [Chloroflexota bacterium]
MTTDPQTSEASEASEAPQTEADGAAGADAGRPAPGGAEARELERQLDEARAQVRAAETRAQENFDRWQRAQADLANYRRRAQFEREELEKYAAASLVASLLPVLDNFDRAWGSLPGQFRRLTWLDGVAMIHSQLRGTLQRVGLVEIEAEGQAFDPALHEAVDSEAGDGPPHVIAVLQAGYKLQERVIRPALVKVGPKASPPPAAAPEGEPAPPPAPGPDATG